MGYNNNSFPVFLSARTDGTFEATVRKFEDFVGSAMRNVADKATQASTVIERQFNFTGASQQLAQFERGALAALDRISRGRNDALGVIGAVAGVKNSPFDAGLRDRVASENALDSQRQAALAKQQAADDKARQSRIDNIQAEFDAAIRSINAETDARQRAQAEGLATAKRNIAALIALDNQRTDAIRANEAARIERTTDRRSGSERLLAGEATLDRAAVAGATLESVLGRVAVRSREVGEAQTEAGRRSEDAMERAARAARELAEEQRKLVAGREFIQAPTFDPGATATAAAAARQHAIALNQIADAAEKVIVTEQGATATDRAFAAQMRQSATAAELEADRLSELAATQSRVVGAAGKFDAANLQLQSGVRNTRFATLQASQQFQDFFIQIQGGQNPMVAFSQQASQLAFVMASTGGQAGKLARFFAGPWGTAFFIGLAALTPLVAKLFETDKAAKKVTKTLEEQTEELIKNAREKRVAEAAESAFARSAEGAVESIAKVTRELIEQNRTLGDNIALKRQGIATDRVTAISELAKAREKEPGAIERVRRAEEALAVAKDVVARVPNSSYEGVNQAEKSLARARETLLEIRSDIGNLTKAITQAEIAERLIDVPMIERRAEEATDAIAAITNKAADDIKKIGQRVGAGELADSAAQAEIERIIRVRDAAIEAEQAKQAAMKETAREMAEFGDPVPGARISSGYGRRARPTKGASTQHLGLDFAAAEGTAVLAAMDGIVKFADKVVGYGNQIELTHGAGTASRYSHLSRFSVQEGQQVRKGDKIGEVGSTGVATGAHLHYEVLVNGKKVDPSKGLFAVDTTRIADQGQKWAEQQQRDAAKLAAEQERLQKIYDQSAERIADINARFDEQPRLVDQAANATRDLDAIISNLGKERPPGFEQLIADAQAAKPIIQEGLTRPLREMVEASNEQAQIDALILAGRGEQAVVMQEIYRLQSIMGPLTEGEAEAVGKIVRAERLRSRALAENEKMIQRQVQAAQGLQDALTGIIANPTDLNSFKDAFERVFSDFQQQWAERISTSVFGNLGQEIEDGLRMKADPLGAAGEQLSTSALDLGQAAVELINASLAMRQNAGPSIGQIGATPTAFGLGQGGSPGALGAALAGPLGSTLERAFDDFFGPANDNDAGAGGIGAVVGAVDAQTRLDKRRLDLEKQSALYADPVAYYNKFGAAVGGKIDKALGTGIFGKIGGKLGTVLEGVQLGGVGGGVADLLGFKTSKLGSSIGGAIGNAILPGIGGIVGGFLGGIVGGLFKKTKTGVGTISGNAAGNLDVTGSGNSASRKEAAVKVASAVIDPLEDLADRLGVALDASVGRVSIGIRDKDYRVDPTGRGATKKKKGAIDFGQDEQAAIEFAMRDLIKDGVLGPIRDGTKKLLLNARTLSSGIEKALKFEDVFKRLARYVDPVGAAIAELDVEFQGLRRLFAEAGASAGEYAQLEQLYLFERSEAIKQAAKDMASSLKALLDELQYKGDTGLSLRTRESNALQAFRPFEQQIASGQAFDQDAFADVARSLLEIQREIYGSTSSYFDSLNYITELTKQAINQVGGSVGVPGVTAAPPATYNQPPAATPLPGTVPAGYSATVPGGGALATAANDNAREASQVVAAIKEQTNIIAPLLSQGAIVTAIQVALGTKAATGAAGGSSESRNLIHAVNRLNGDMAGNLVRLIDATNGTGERLTRFADTALRRTGTYDGFGINPASRIGLSSNSVGSPVSATSTGTSTFGSRFSSQSFGLR